MSAHDYAHGYAHNYGNKSCISDDTEDEVTYNNLEDTFDYILIQKIKKNPCLYNTKIKATKVQKSNIWSTITAELQETG